MSAEAAELGLQHGSPPCAPLPGLDLSHKHVLVGDCSDHSSSENVVSAHCPLL